MPIDPSTILYEMPKPGGRESVLLRRLWSTGVPRLEITVASCLPSGAYHAVRGVGIGPDMLEAFAEAVPATVGAVLASGSATGPLAVEGASTASPAKDTTR